MSDPRLAAGRGRRHCGDTPARRRGARPAALARRLRRIAPAPHDEGGDTGALGGELQAAARHHRQRSDLADHCRGDAAGAQPLLHRPQNLGVVRGPDQHEAAGIEPLGGEAEAVKIRSLQTPRHNAIGGRGEPADDAGGKGGGERAVLLVAAPADNFVQGAAHQPAARQHAVDRGDPERHHPVLHRRRPLDPPHPFAKLGKPNHVYGLF